VSATFDEGTLVNGKYRVVRKLGEGGMGEVLLARHTELHQDVAIKILRADLADHPIALERFLREARAIARIDSEHVVRVFDVGRLDDGLPYMVMEYLEGEDLERRLERGVLPVEEAVDYILQACMAIGEAHRVGVIHRDLKPSNLFLARRRDGSSVIKVLDFGISKVMSRGERAEAALTGGGDALMGSPFYMAPEQLAGDKEADGRTDVWALGLILFELLTNEGPFVADTLPLLCTRILHTPARRISEARTDLDFPSGLEEIIDLCLAKDPKARFDDVVDLAMVLAPYGTAGRAGAISEGNLPTKPPESWDATRRGLTPIQVTAPGVGPTSLAPEGLTIGADPEEPITNKLPAVRRRPKWIAIAGAGVVVLLSAGVLGLVGISGKAPPARATASGATTQAAMTATAAPSSTPSVVAVVDEPAPVSSVIAAPSATAPKARSTPRTTSTATTSGTTTRATAATATGTGDEFGGRK
jgi:serine/threonine-protein kinase